MYIYIYLNTYKHIDIYVERHKCSSVFPIGRYVQSVNDRKRGSDIFNFQVERYSTFITNALQPFVPRIASQVQTLDRGPLRLDGKIRKNKEGHSTQCREHRFGEQSFWQCDHYDRTLIAPITQSSTASIVLINYELANDLQVISRFTLYELTTKSRLIFQERKKHSTVKE